MKKVQLYNQLPQVIKSLLIASEGWLVGSSIVTTILGKESPKDYDIIVSSRELFQIGCKILALLEFSVSVNTFGGIKFKKDNISIDIWCEELSHYLRNRNTSKGPVYNLKSQILIEEV